MLIYKESVSSSFLPLNSSVQLSVLLSQEGWLCREMLIFLFSLVNLTQKVGLSTGSNYLQQSVNYFLDGDRLSSEDGLSYLSYYNVWHGGNW